MADQVVEEVEFAGLGIRFDRRVLRPRQWTVLQSDWAAELLPRLPPGPVLELCCGAGQIGLAAMRGSARRLVCVDREPAATAYATENARRSGMAHRVEVRAGDLITAVRPHERYALVLADPPWVPRSETESYPDDPRGAIDGGADGLSVARTCVAVAAAHLAAGGACLLQLGTAAQVESLGATLAEAGLHCVEVRTGARGVVALLERRCGRDPM